MKLKEILVFGATGQVGKSLIRRLTRNNYKVIAVTRNIHQKGYYLKTQANPGYLELKELVTFDENNLRNLISECDVCINLIGILYENKKNQFNTIHSVLPNLISRIASEQNIDQFVHISALGIEKAIDSNYALSKINGENAIQENFKRSVILKPSLVYSVDDNFTTNFMTLLSRLPFMPLYYNGETKFTPIHVSDLSEIICNVIQNKNIDLKLECLGPEVLSFKEILLNLLKSINKKRLLIPMPLPIAKITAKVLEKFPNPLLTEDQLRLLKYDNIASGSNKTNYDLGYKADKLFKSEIEKYSYNWRSGGQYTKREDIIKE